MIDRRNFMAGAGAFALGAWANGATATGIEKRLSMPPLLDATASGKFDLIAQAGETLFHGKSVSRTWGFNQPFLGPTVRVRSKGDTLANVSNTLREDISVHWHGLVVPGSVDGGPHQSIRPGETWQPVLPIDQKPCTAWYHSHQHGETAAQVQRGLAGVLQLSDGQDAERGLPITYGVDDLTLVLQDRRFDRNGRMTYDPSMRDSMMGFLGNRILVNGQIEKTAVVPRGVVRLRLLNGSNARILTLAMSDGRPMHQIATDSGFLPRPMPMQMLPLAPGERAEVLVDFSSGNGSSLVSGANPNMGMMGRGMMNQDTFASGFVVLPFAIDDDAAPAVTKLPDDIGGAFAVVEQPTVTRRNIVLEMGMGMGGMMRMFGGDRFSINGDAFSMKRINLETRLDSVEEWNVSGAMMMHPFHVHGVAFQVVSENGNAPRPHNLGWKDTVLINGEAVIRMRFDREATRDLPYMYHCHILEHEDGGMMGQFTVS